MRIRRGIFLRSLAGPVALVGLVALSNIACVAQRLVVPKLVVDRAPSELPHIKLELTEFRASNVSRADLKRNGRKAIERAFIAYMNQSLGVASVKRRANELSPHDPDAVELEVDLAVDQTTNRTIVFDGLFFSTGTGFPLVPSWGDVSVVLVWQTKHHGQVEGPFKVTVEAPYSVLFYSYYRRRPIEDAFRRVHETAFKEMVERLGARLRVIEAQAAAPAPVATSSVAALDAVPVLVSIPPEVGPEPGPEPPPEPGPSVATEALGLAPSAVAPEPGPSLATEALGLALSAVAPEPGPDLAPVAVRLRPVGVNIITEPFWETEPPGLLKRYFGALGGLEASLTGGSATVQSNATTRTGIDELVASGNARSHGYRISLYKPPTETGFFFPPALGFMSQTIEISGFRQDVPLFVPTGSTGIPAVVSDPATGMGVDATQPIAYRLDLKSGYIGQGIGLNLVIGTEDVQFFSTGRVGLNLAEYRYSDVTFYQSRVKGGGFAFLQSGQLGAQAGFSFPAIHLAVRAAVEYEWYRQFNYPQPVEFQASVAYNREKQIFERQRVFVDGAQLQTLDWLLSAVMLF